MAHKDVNEPCAPPLSEGPLVDEPCGEEVAQTAAGSPPDPVEELKKEILGVKTELESVKDSKLRLLAEFDNFKRRTARESIRMIESANESLIKELLPVLENFERALDPAHKEQDIVAFYKGIELIHSLFNDKLKKAGLTETSPLGEEFDAEKHEAVMQMSSDTVAEHKIAQVLQKGYMLNGRVVQYPKVAVSTGKG